MATRMAGTAAMMANRPTMRTCSREPARPARRACTINQTSRTMMPSSSSTVTAFTSSSVTTTSWVGEIGVKSARTMKVMKADKQRKPDGERADHPRFRPPGGWRRERSLGSGGLFDAQMTPGRRLAGLKHPIGARKGVSSRH